LNLTQLKQDCHFLCGSTSGTYPDTDLVRNINIAYQDTARLVWSSAGGWQFDDSNATTLPIAKTTMVHNQKDYTLPATTQKIEQVIVQDKDGGWNKLTPIDIHDKTVPLDEYSSGNGLPLYYDLVGRSIMLYPSPGSAYCTMASGLGVYVSRDVTEFATTATTTIPGFATPFHRILSYAAAIDFSQDSNQRQMLVSQKDRLEKGLIKFYSDREVEGNVSVKPRHKKYWKQYT